MVDLEVNPDRFAFIKEKAKRGYQNFFMEQPWEHGRYEAEVILTNHRWLVTEKIDAIDGNIPFHYLSIYVYLTFLFCCSLLKDLTYTDLQAFIAPLMKQVFLELLVMGNMGKEDALALGNMFVDIVKPRVLRPSMFPERRVIRLANQTTYSFKKRGPNPANPNSALYTYYQVPFLSTFFSFLIWVNYLGRTTKRGYECIALCAGSNMR